jgi:UrcA family protein
MTKFLVSVALAASLATASQAQNAAGADTFSTAVRAGDLNLASPGGLATFRGRVRAAADRSCGAAPTRPLVENNEVSRCRAELARSAEMQVGLAMSRIDDAVVGTR